MLQPRKNEAIASTPLQSAHRLPKPSRSPARPPASAQRQHPPPSPAPSRLVASTPEASPPNPPHSKAPAQHRHSASHSRRHCKSTPGRARTPAAPIRPHNLNIEEPHLRIVLVVCRLPLAHAYHVGLPFKTGVTPRTFHFASGRPNMIFVKNAFKNH